MFSESMEKIPITGKFIYSIVNNFMQLGNDLLFIYLFFYGAVSATIYCI